MKVKIIRTTVAEKRTVRAGDIEDLSDSEAKTLILLGKAVEVANEAPVVVEPVAELNTENAAPVIAEEMPRRGRKSRKD